MVVFNDTKSSGNISSRISGSMVTSSYLGRVCMVVLVSLHLITPTRRSRLRATFMVLLASGPVRLLASGPVRKWGSRVDSEIETDTFDSVMSY